MAAEALEGGGPGILFESDSLAMLCFAKSAKVIEPNLRRLRANMSVTVKIKMPNAVFKAIQKFQHEINADLPAGSGYEVTVEGAIMLMVLNALSGSDPTKSSSVMSVDAH